MIELDHEALWLKSKLFVNLAMDEVEWRTFDEKGVWASIALELLAKAALSRTSPLLITSATDDAASNLAAVGLIEPTRPPSTLQAARIWERCERVFKPFNAQEASQVANARNGYLHSGTPTFATIPPEAWWPKYWAQAIILVNALDRTLYDFVGQARVEQVEAFLAQNKKNLEHRVQMLIDRAKQRYRLSVSGDMSAKLAAELGRPTRLSAGLRYSADVACPACSEIGRVEGEDVDDYTVHWEQVEEGEYEGWVDVTVTPSYFYCGTCRLVFENYETLAEAGLDASFETLGSVEDFAEYEYNNE